MPSLGHLFWLVLLVLATSVWLGGYVAIAVVARASSASLTPAAKVAFFRALGRAYLPVGSAALVLAFVSGGVLLRGRAIDGVYIAAAVTAALLVLVLAVAVAQARRLTELRQSANAKLGDNAPPVAVVRGGSFATLLRALLGVLSMTLVVLGCVMVVY